MTAVLLGLFILLSYTIEAMTGFGSIVIALSLGAMFLPIDTLLPILVPLNLGLSGFLVITQRRHIQWPMLLKVIAPLMVAGTVLGTWLRPAIGNQELATLLALVVASFGARELWKAHKQRPEKPHGRTLNQLLIGGAGITHGLFASGGPLLVFALAGGQLNKAQLRATLLCVWFSLNLLLTLIFAWQGKLQAALPDILLYTPMVLGGLFIGDYLHHRVAEQQFRQWVYGVLTVIGIMLLIRASL
ncbi:sulfite exporter TauE/SafE family protein [Simiduia sp. 21SJ11W-1]|uniref:sulfite exporter TauE/SafE family protein n=1 Tax=Simiduia sp. 21SJ11W-1 TaxID=2909669 RepID=UPI0020A1228E|nr:sulfite exporter TauE/SafE family protein [Simiduia sp. 21SJ11W-1]UTA46877.1 sulfite exporter TauE/SafE family protein [Simiduia sp. 21SJ11W-1]